MEERSTVDQFDLVMDQNFQEMDHFDRMTDDELYEILAMDPDDVVAALEASAMEQHKVRVSETQMKVFSAGLDRYESDSDPQPTPAELPKDETVSRNPSPPEEPKSPVEMGQSEDVPEQPEEQTQTLSVSTEDLLPSVSRALHWLSEMQWSMLATGELDTSTVATLIQVLTDVIQSLVAEIVKTVLNIYKDLTTAERRQLHASLGDSLNGSIAKALGVPVAECDSAKQLTQIVEKEVSERVNSAVSLASSSPVLPPEPAIYISGAVTTVSTLRQMACHAAACLKRYAVKLSCRQPNSDDSDKSTESIISSICVDAVTGSVRDILDKWSPKSAPISEEAPTASPSISSTPESERVAADIVRMIVSDLHICESPEESPEKSPRPHFKMDLIINKVRNFFASHAASSENAAGAKEVRKRSRFSKAAKMQFEKMVSDLKSTLKRKDAEFLVDLEEQESQESDDKCHLPGSVPGSPRSVQLRHSPSYLVILPRGSRKDSLEFDSIKPGLDKLYDMLSQSDKAGKHVTQASIREAVRQYARELTEKMYCHLMDGSAYYIPVTEPGKSLSEQVLSKTKLHGESNHSHEVWYVMTEDAVEKYLQNVLFCAQEPSLEMAHSEEVAGALEDIKNVFIKTTTPPEESVTEQEIPAAPARPSPVPGPSEPSVESIHSDDEGCEMYCTPVVAIKWSQSLDSLVSVHEQSEPSHSSTSLEGGTTDVEFEPNQSSSPEPGTMDLIAAPQPKAETSDFQPEKSQQQKIAISALVLKVLNACTSKARTVITIADYKAVLKGMSKLQLDDIDVPADRIKKKMDKLVKGIVKDLHEAFGRELPALILMSEDSDIDDAVARIFKKHLHAITEPKQKCAVARFFSAACNWLGSILSPSQ